MRTPEFTSVNYDFRVIAKEMELRNNTFMFYLNNPNQQLDAFLFLNNLKVQK